MVQSVLHDIGAGPVAPDQDVAVLAERMSHPGEDAQTLLGGFKYFSSGNYIWIGFEYNRLIVKIPVNGNNEPPQSWYGPKIEPGDIDLQIILNTEMGPGGIMFRLGEDQPLSSLYTETCHGLENSLWPDKWTIGYDHTGMNFPDHKTVVVAKNKPFKGKDLKISFFITT